MHSINAPNTCSASEFNFAVGIFKTLQIMPDGTMVTAVIKSQLILTVSFYTRILEYCGGSNNTRPETLSVNWKRHTRPSSWGSAGFDSIWSIQRTTYIGSSTYLMSSNSRKIYLRWPTKSESHLKVRVLALQHPRDPIHIHTRTSLDVTHLKNTRNKWGWLLTNWAARVRKGLHSFIDFTSWWGSGLENSETLLIPKTLFNIHVLWTLGVL